MTWVGLLVLSWIVLYVLWRFLDLTFKALEHWHAAAAESREAPTHTKGKVTSDLSQPSSSSSSH